MTNIENLPLYMQEWYKTYEFYETTHIKLGKLKPEIVASILQEYDSTKVSKLSNTAINYGGYGIFTHDGNINSWDKRFKIENPDITAINSHVGHIKTVKNIPSISCNLNAPVTYEVLSNFTNLKRAAYVLLHENSEMNYHADNPPQEGLRFHINLNNSESTYYYFGNDVFTLEVGEIVWINTGMLHNAVNISNSSRLNIMIDVEFQSDITAEILNIKNNLLNNNYLI